MSTGFNFKTKPTATAPAANPTNKPNQSVFGQLPDSTEPLLLSAPTLWREIKTGDFPASVKLSERFSCWQVGAIWSWIAAHVAQTQTPAQGTSEPTKSLLTRMGSGIQKLAEVADGIEKIRNAIEGLYKLAGAIWPVLLLLWPN